MEETTRPTAGTGKPLSNLEMPAPATAGDGPRPSHLRPADSGTEGPEGREAAAEGWTRLALGALVVLALLTALGWLLWGT